MVKEAQEVKDLDELLPYVENPLKTTILVIAHKYKKIDRRKALAKSVEKHGVLFESARIYDNKIPEWIVNQINIAGYKISPKAAMILSENLGNNLSKIRNEMNKLFINVEKGTTINEDMIERNIGISKDYNIFELTNALGKIDVEKANKIANYFADNVKLHPLTLTLSMVFNYFLKLMLYHQTKDRSKNNVASVLSVHPFFVPEYTQAAQKYPLGKLVRIMSEIRNYDLRLKGINNNNTSEGELLKELIFKILH
jgi:DNA polymerase-3 subunit delta